MGFEGVQEVGRGGFGVVFRCTEPSLERTVAVKLLTQCFDGGSRARFLREQQAMGRLSGHPNIVDVFQIGNTANGLPYIVMPYHPNGSLEKRIRRDGPLGWVEALYLGIKLAGALESAHEAGVLHRDVKPANILLTDYGDLQLADFGISRLVGAFETAEGELTGSPAFTAPEVLSGGPATVAGDVYSLGATLFCAITGHALYERLEGEAIVEQFLRITNGEKKYLPTRAVPDDICEILDRTMARNPALRPGCAAELGEELRAVERRNHLHVDDMVIRHTGNKMTGNDQPTQIQQAVSGSRGKWGVEQRVEVSDTPGGQQIPPQPPAIPAGSRDMLGNLPFEVTSFVGRRTELAQAKKFMSASRLVTLTGIGGIGKTRLALRIALESRRAFVDGVWLAELGELRDEMLVASTALAALGVQGHTAAEPVRALVDHLNDKHLLLVLDNCEHVVEEVAAIAETLLRTCSDIRILVTSREPLCIGGEKVLRVPPMIVPTSARESSGRPISEYEAVNLFVERATAVAPTFRLMDANQRAVAQICRHLDGLPLSIELAAVRLRAMSAQQILERLNDRYRILTAGSRTAPSRQQTLRMCIEWSYDLCTEREQALWARLSVFAGTFELEAAESICKETDLGEMSDLVTSLVDKSILIREDIDSMVRYRLLDTLREYGRLELIASGNEETLRRRHTDWYEQLILRAETDWISPRQLDWISRLDREQSNIREVLQRYLTDDPDKRDHAVRVVAALLPFWVSRGVFLTEARTWIGRILSVHREQTADRATALYLSSVFAVVQGNVDESLELLAEGDIIAERLGDTALAAFANWAGGCHNLYNSVPTRAVVLFETAISQQDGIGYTFCKIASLIGLGLSHLQLDNVSGAHKCYDAILVESAKYGETVYRGRAATIGGWALWREGDSTQAQSVLRQGIRLSDCIDDRIAVARCFEILGRIEADQRLPSRAAVLSGAASSIWRGVGGPSSRSVWARDEREMRERSTQQALGKAEYDKQFKRGSSLTYRDAVSYALGEEPSAPETTSNEPSLTRREREVAALVAQGLTNKAIAANLVISPRTAQGHVEHILVKLGFTSRAQIAAWVTGKAME
ncbi:protein kinase [Rhodococcus sp. IEGM 1366]|uniref:protein kinase domain-containing protein n=1 Tax=Rhodococcus sp. IEGM 1366 TaxID=3082223 RepID=UPI0029547BE0|nr:protein kinase [Rhodococcus sp. IEGM 1366]MDV8070677.1 protein kinase [Rhodococcus sp. IEGM 1366]